jgi:hypothetical protein
MLGSELGNRSRDVSCPNEWQEAQLAEGVWKPLIRETQNRQNWVTRFRFIQPIMTVGNPKTTTPP